MSGAPARPPWSGLGKAVEVLAPRAPDFTAFLDATFAPPPVPPGPDAEPFAPGAIAAVDALSAAFLADPVLRQDPASVAVAFWMRRAQLSRLAAEFERRAQADLSVVRVPVGRVFHLAPANVDTLFLYSWALSFLCGNANVVRLSQDRPPIVDAMLRAIDGLARERPGIRDRNRFVTYAHDREATTAISAWCAHRVIWGGDETVAALRGLPLHPHASERTFGSKFSYSVVSASRYLEAGAEARARVAEGFFNDLFWFDQMACSSPHVLFWVGGEDEADAAADAFDERLQAEVERRGFMPSAASAVHRRAFAFDLAADADVRVTLERPGFVTVRVRDERALAREICGGGLLRHARLERLEVLAGYARESDQTVTHFGFEPAELRALAAAIGLRGVDRIVPVGEALAFDVVWDGFDLLDDFTRRVRVHPA